MGLLRSVPDKTKVLVIIPSGFCYGLQHISFSLFNTSRDKIEPFFLISKWSDGEFEREIQKMGFKFSHSWLGMFSRKMDAKNIKMSLHALSKLPALYRDFWKLYKSFKPDILFFANHHELILLYPALAFIRRPVVCHMHDPAPALSFQKRTFSFYMKKVKKILAISENVKQRIIALGGKENEITVLHNGIVIPATPDFERDNTLCKKAQWPDDVFIIGITGQMSATKGHEDLLNAFAKAYKNNKALRLIIGGKPSYPFSQTLQTLIDSLALKDVVYFSGWQEEASSFFRSIDLYVLASRHDEGYGLVIAEAMAFSKPTVITASGGAVELVKDGVTGFIVPKRDIDALAQKIEIFATDKVLYENARRAAYAYAKSHFDLQKKAIDFSNFLEKVK